MAKGIVQSDVFQSEIDFLNEVRALAENDSIPPETVKENYKALCTKYERLIGEAKLLTSVSDRLHSKLNEANEKLKRQSDEINKINDDLKVNNNLLQDTIDQLVKAKVGRKASSIVLLIAILLFIVSEGVLEPFVEEKVGNEQIGFLFKLGIAILLKPIDVLVERYMMRKALKDRKAARVIENRE